MLSLLIPYFLFFIYTFMPDYTRCNTFHNHKHRFVVIFTKQVVYILWLNGHTYNSCIFTIQT